MKKQNTLTKSQGSKAGGKRIGPIRSFFDKQRNSGNSVVANKYSGSLRNDKKKAATSGKLIQKKVVTVTRDAEGNIDFYPQRDSSDEGVDDSPMSPP